MASAPLFGNPAISEKLLTRGFASQPHDWFAVIGEGSKSNLLKFARQQDSMPERFDRIRGDCIVGFGKDFSSINQNVFGLFPKGVGSLSGPNRFVQDGSKLHRNLSKRFLTPTSADTSATEKAKKSYHDSDQQISKAMVSIVPCRNEIDHIASCLSSNQFDTMEYRAEFRSDRRRRHVGRRHTGDCSASVGRRFASSGGRQSWRFRVHRSQCCDTGSAGIDHHPDGRAHKYAPDYIRQCVRGA